MMFYRLDERGVALLTVLLLGIIAMALVAVAYFAGGFGSRMSGVEKRYAIELETAKGAADYVMGDLRNINLTCNGGNPCATDIDGDPGVADPNNGGILDKCDAAAQIDIPGAVCTALGKAGCAGLSACYLTETSTTASTYPKLISVHVSSLKQTGGENAIVEFVYKLE